MPKSVNHIYEVYKTFDIDEMHTNYGIMGNGFGNSKPALKEAAKEYATEAIDNPLGGFKVTVIDRCTCEGKTDEKTLVVFRHPAKIYIPFNQFYALIKAVRSELDSVRNDDEWLSQGDPMKPPYIFKRDVYCATDEEWKAVDEIYSTKKKDHSTGILGNDGVDTVAGKNLISAGIGPDDLLQYARITLLRTSTRDFIIVMSIIGIYVEDTKGVNNKNEQ